MVVRLVRVTHDYEVSIGGGQEHVLKQKGFMRSQNPKTLKMYALAGILTAVDSSAGKITIYDAHAAGFGTPIERDYTLQDKAAASKSKPGDFVHATLLTDHANVWLLEDVTFVTKRIRRTGTKP